MPAPPAAPAPASVPLAYRAAGWDSLPGWPGDNPAEAIGALLASCASLATQTDWQAACARAAQLRRDDAAGARRFFETAFIAYEVRGRDGKADGLVTGYYEPLLSGSRKPDTRYRYPLYGVPDDLVSIDLGDQYPELRGMRLRGRLEGRKVVPYYTRAEIEHGEAPVKGKELLWVDDAVELFFLQVQGSGRVKLPGGETVRVGYAEHNGHPYKSIGRVLIERGEIAADKASMQGIKHWARQNPDLLPLLLQQNPAYVFFRELPGDEPGPIGALGVALTAGRSIAVDPTALPLGAPVYLASTWPLSTKPLNRVVLAQDTGSAIKGAARADFFWGFGDDAGALAGRMRQGGRLWLLYPRGF
ncbi:MAG TPA: MltA domain-containing protein, partial [Burkholderiales bacterium]|nr:MltA domain-containing protein [Burkholderiales bacterium]